MKRLRLINIRTCNCIFSLGVSWFDDRCWFFYYAPFSYPYLKIPSHPLILIKLHHKKKPPEIKSWPCSLSPAIFPWQFQNQRVLSTLCPLTSGNTENFSTVRLSMAVFVGLYICRYVQRLLSACLAFHLNLYKPKCVKHLSFSFFFCLSFRSAVKQLTL